MSAPMCVGLCTPTTPRHEGRADAHAADAAECDAGVQAGTCVARALSALPGSPVTSRRLSFSCGGKPWSSQRRCGIGLASAASERRDRWE